jgi:hypothetical protein
MIKKYTSIKFPFIHLETKTRWTKQENFIAADTLLHFLCLNLFLWCAFGVKQWEKIDELAEKIKGTSHCE